MLFNSIEFLLFLPVVFLLYWYVFNRSLVWQNGLVLVASYFFYGWWSWSFMGLLMLSTVLDYAYGFGVASANRKRARFFLVASVVNNLGILGAFKYYDFFVTEIQKGLAGLGFQTHPTLLQLALPIGISFYTFHGMSYVFDIYHGRQQPVRRFIDYAVFVSFFPLLVAGPIERAGHLLPQVQKRRTFRYAQAVEGCRLILWGLFKKVVIADALAGIVDEIFQHYPEKNGSTLLVGAIAFSFQIYGDFSGYSDIALGTAKLFGFELLSNFKFPYFSRDVAEFWRKWHISLSTWFRDYLYIPLGGSRDGRLKAVRNTFIIFLVSGFWHGASWNFLTWGFIHACGFLPLLLLNRNRKHVTSVVAPDRRLPSLTEMAQMASTFTFVTLAWVFFRSEGMDMALGYLRQMAHSFLADPGQLLKLPGGKLSFVYILPLLLGDWYLRRDERNLRTPNHPLIRLALYYALFALVAYAMLTTRNSSFIYYQF